MNKKQLAFGVRARWGPAVPWRTVSQGPQRIPGLAGQGPHQPGTCPMVSLQGKQSRPWDCGQVQPGTQIIRQGHSDEDGPKPGQDRTPSTLIRGWGKLQGRLDMAGMGCYCPQGPAIRLHNMRSPDPVVALWKLKTTLKARQDFFKYKVTSRFLLMKV